MYRELRADLRGLQQSVDSVHSDLADHIQEEMGVHQMVSDKLGEMRAEIAAIRTRQGAITAGISALVAAVVAWGSNFFR